MKTFKELIKLDNDYTTDSYMKAYNRLHELIDNAEIDKAKTYLTILKIREEDLLELFKYMLSMERKEIAESIGVKEGEY